MDLLPQVINIILRSSIYTLNHIHSSFNSISPGWSFLLSISLNKYFSWSTEKDAEGLSLREGHCNNL